MKDLQEKLLTCLGGSWPEGCELNIESRTIETYDEYELRRLSYDVQADERINAYLLVPINKGDKPLPGICVWHQHCGEWHLGKSEPAGLAGNPMHYTGVALAKAGYVVLCADTLGFEERAEGYKQKDGDLERFLFCKYLVEGKNLAWKNILDMKRAVDVLAQCSFVDEQRLGCYGHSMGSTNAWMVGPWEHRLKAVVANCCMPTYEAINDAQITHCFANFIPGWKQYGDTGDIAGLIAPRRLHLNIGELDDGSPMNGVHQAVKVIDAAYEAQHCANQFTSYIEQGSGHVLSDTMFEKVLAVFDEALKI